MSIQIRRATLEDIPLLAQMNQALIEDEHSPNLMTYAELEARMRQWLSDAWVALLFLDDAIVVGHILYQERQDEIRTDLPNIYVRQFFIKPEYRRRGIGHAIIEQIVEHWLPANATVTLDVLETNSGSQQFWNKLGFEVYRTTLRRILTGKVNR